MSKIDLSIIIPLYNEENYITLVLDEIKAKIVSSFEVIVVDDCSTDNSLSLVQEWQASNPDVSLLIKQHETNRGKSQGIITGLKHCTGEYTIAQDADLEYSVEDINSVLEYAKENQLDSVITYRKKRFLQYNPIDLILKSGSGIITLLFNLLYNTEFKDLSSCYKLIKTDLMKELDLKGKGFTFCYESVAKLAKSNATTGQYEVSYQSRSRDDGKKIKMHDGFFCFLETLKHLNLSSIINSRLLFYLLLPVIMLLPTIINTDPLLFHDTIDYIHLPHLLEYPQRHTLVLTFVNFLFAGFRHFNIWSVLLFNLAITLYTFFRFNREMAIDLGSAKLSSKVVVLLLLGFSPLAYHVNFLMPDIYYLPSFVFAYLIIKDKTLNSLDHLILILSLTCHPTHFAVTLLTAIVYFLINRSSKKVIARLAITLIISAAVLKGDHVYRKHLGYEQGNNIELYFAATLVEEGLADKTLKNHCPELGIKLCQAKLPLPQGRDDFLWLREHALHQLYGDTKKNGLEFDMNAFRSEETRKDMEKLILTTLTHYPIETMIALTKRMTIRGLPNFIELGFEIDDHAFKRMSALTRWVLLKLPMKEPWKTSNHQVHGKFPRTYIYLLNATGILTFLFALYIGWRGRKYRPNLVSFSSLCFIIHFTLVPLISTHAPRYLSKNLMILIPLILFMALQSKKKPSC